eukprot:scaffold54294_cov70-Phaeocystis_antarctica.AAC.1
MSGHSPRPSDRRQHPSAAASSVDGEKYLRETRDRGSNPTARPRGRPDAFEARFFCILLLIRSQHSGPGPLIWASRALGCPQGALCG